MDRKKDRVRLHTVRAGQSQHLLHQTAHLPGHDQDVCGKGGAVLDAVARILQKLRIGHDDGQRRL